MRTLSKMLTVFAVAAALSVPMAAQADGRGKRHDDGYYGGPPVAFGFSFGYVDDGYRYGKGDYDRHGKHGKHGKHKKYGKHGHGKHKYGKHGKGHGHGPEYGYGHGGYGHTYDYRPKRRHSGGYDRGVHGCHPVTRVEYHHGRKAKFGGTMCYDRWGNAFIVPGSRHLIHYYH